MNKNILSKYKLNFINQRLDGNLNKLVINGNDLLIEYLLDLSANEILNWAIPEVDKVLNDYELDADIDSTSIWVEVLKDYSVLRSAWDNNKTFQLDTNDFKQILLSWAEFLDMEPN